MITETLWMVNTRTCNLDCTFCYQGSHKWKWQQEAGLQKLMNSRTAKRALTWASQWATRGLRVNWYGGEPLQNMNLMAEVMPQWERAFKGIQKELKWSITTNGTLLDSDARALLDEHNVGVLLSVDGPPHIHNKQRTYYGGKPSWEDIPIDEILAWRPNIETAWVICPDNVPTPADFDWMIARGFRRMNFNMNWSATWSPGARIQLQEFTRWVARRCIQSLRGELYVTGTGTGTVTTQPEQHSIKVSVNSNLMAKFHELHIKDIKQAVPCGTGTHMLALTPEGHLYPSQEMAFKAFEPNVAPGTKEHYMVGNIWHDPVINVARLADVSGIRNSDMRTPEGFDCSNCAANPISFGGCHCRYIGQDGHDPTNRHDIAPGWCQSTQAWVAGMLLGARIEKYSTLKSRVSSRPGVTKPQESGPHDMHTHDQPNNQPLVEIQPSADTLRGNRRLDLSDVYDEIMKLKRMLKTSELQKLQAQLQDMDAIMRPVAKRLNREET